MHLLTGNEELRAVGVPTSIGHGQVTRSSVLDLEVLICEARSVDGLSSTAVEVGEVTTLDHESSRDKTR